jgi:Fe-S cluster assembly protein SufB
VKRHPELVRKYLGSVVPYKDNFYACLNAAVFSDGSFAFIPPGVTCPLDLSTYFRINSAGLGQFERTLVVADSHAKVSYLEGCTAPARSEHQLHAAVVELVALESAEIRYSTVQNWYAGDRESGRGGVLNFVTKRGICLGDNSRIFWTQVETGSAITWKYPSCILRGENSHGEFHSVSVTSGRQQADTGTKMIHLGAGSTSRIIAKGIASEQSINVYRGVVRMGKNAINCRNFSCCDSLLLDDGCVSATVPSLDSGSGAGKNSIEHEASTSRLSSDQLLLLESRGLSQSEAAGLVLEGFCRDVLINLPLEFAQEASKLLSLKLENSIG